MNLKEMSRGIPHIEDLEVSEFITALNSWELHEATEKLDGAQILFGIDEIGFYTSRETKGGKRMYSESEYEVSFPTTYMRSVHILLESVYSHLKAAGMRPGDQVEAEVLHGFVPNVVPYSEGINYLIFLRTTEGKVNINRLKQELTGKSLLIPIVEPYTVDGRTVQTKQQMYEWAFSRAPMIPVDASIRKKYSAPLIELINFNIARASSVPLCNAIAAVTPLNKVPVWCKPEDWKTVKEELKAERAAILEKMMEYKMQIKEILLDHYVRLQSSAFGPEIEFGGWIEGVVMRRPDTGKMFKLVDKNTFTRVLKEAWAERNLLTEAAKGVDADNSFLGQLYVDMATALGHPNLGTIQAKSYLRKSETLLEDLNVDLDVESVRDYWIGLLEVKEVQLEARLDKYAKEEAYGVKSVDRYSFAAYERTLETYATSFQRIGKLLEETREARSAEDLLKILVGKHLGN